MKGIILFFKKLNLIDRLIVLYILLSSLYLFIFADFSEQIISHYFARLIIIFLIAILVYFDSKIKNGIINFFRNFYPLITLIYFYPEIDFLDNLLFTANDQKLVFVEEFLFHNQPSIIFYNLLSYIWFNELMFFSYFSFYLIIIFSCIYFYKYFSMNLFHELMFVIIFSFNIYYLIFILFPSAGPQFYFNYSDIEIPVYGIFGKTMRFIQHIGERPAAAFPSSHVGISFIILFYIKKHVKKIYPYLLIVCILLFLSTIYIQAHYLIDSIAGLLTAPIFYFLGRKIYLRFSKVQQLEV